MVVVLLVLGIAGAGVFTQLLRTPPAILATCTPPPPAARAGTPASASAELGPAPEPSAIEEREQVMPPIAPAAWIHGTVSRRGLPVAGRRVCCEPGTERIDVAVTAADGSFAFRVPPGVHFVEVEHAVGVREQLPELRLGPFDATSHAHAASRSLTVAADDVRCDFALPGGTITVRAVDAVTGVPLAHAGVALWQAPPPAMQRLRVPIDGGVCTLADVESGRHTITVQARAYAAAATAVTIDDRQPMAVVHLALEPTGAVDIVFVDEAGEALELSAALQMRLLSPMTTAVVEPVNAKAFSRQPRPRAFEFDGLESGIWWPSLGNERVDARGGAIRFLPVELLDPLPAEIEASTGVLRKITVRARYRCHARLRAVDRHGNREDVVISVTWLDPVHGPTPVLAAPWYSGGGFEGYLAAGVYEVVCTRDGLRHVDTLTVGGDAVDREFVLPW
ncbi:MAG: hypothetical protein IPK26_31405 [Planctomycetes bacterium]|nr:hypothetical protein [Planctomycetota bacterium]